jgi:acyl-CoA oxidase
VTPVADFVRERGDAGFATREMAHLLAGGPRMTAAKEFAMRQFERLPWLHNAGVFDEPRPEARVRTMAQIRTLFRVFIADQGDMDLRNARIAVAQAYNPDWLTRNGIHFGLFVSAITSQGTPEQQNHWLPLAMSLQLFGCFAMTEL